MNLLRVVQFVLIGKNKAYDKRRNLESYKKNRKRRITSSLSNVAHGDNRWIVKRMELIVEPCYALPCELETFTINGKAADSSDFGDHVFLHISSDKYTTKKSKYE